MESGARVRIASKSFRLHFISSSSASVGTVLITPCRISPSRLLRPATSVQTSLSFLISMQILINCLKHGIAFAERLHQSALQEEPRDISSCRLSIHPGIPYDVFLIKRYSRRFKCAIQSGMPLMIVSFAKKRDRIYSNR
eukprot:TRINITY_DN10665_c0_g1_i1.p1 TRINITY_DN10665_c0_g1~~TRINITY_DN10665_c0_g1_i1.p1  ORF type:complete len:139 (+),score=0.44 TRINITY_DN10665_c0_g1_i1:49-465(+)